MAKKDVIEDIKLFLEVNASDKLSRVKSIEEDPTLSPDEKKEKIIGTDPTKKKMNATKKEDSEESAIPVGQLTLTATPSENVTSKTSKDISEKINDVFAKLGFDGYKVNTIGSKVGFKNLTKDKLTKIVRKVVSYDGSGYRAKKRDDILPYRYEVTDMGDSFDVTFFISNVELFKVSGEPKNSEEEEKEEVVKESDESICISRTELLLD